MISNIAHHGHVGEIVCTSFPACPSEISRQLSSMRGVLCRHGLADTLRDTVTLVLGEVLNNIAEHAVTEENGTILVQMMNENGRLMVQTEDAGCALPVRLLGQQELPDMGTSVDDLPEGGFGWFIIHSLVDDMVYERHGGRNRLSFSFCATCD